jgi:prepilin-type processing-associated H-X9-DG protein
VTTENTEGKIDLPMFTPSYNVVYMPAPSPASNWVIPPGNSRDTISFRHPYFKAANFLYFDGHAATLKAGDDIADNGNRMSHMLPSFQ